MRREGVACMDAGSCPTREPEGKSRGYREATIYRREPGLPGWWRLSHPGTFTARAVIE
ncbi:transcriptional regulator [Enterobacter sp. RVSM5a]|nr:transcriptional regulator [Enterobacter sp. RVSM5a]